MKFFSRFPVFRFLLPFAAGICLYLDNPSSPLPVYLTLAIIGYTVSWWFTARRLATGKHAQRWLAGFPFYCCYLGMGFVLSWVNDSTRFTGHFESGPGKKMLLAECSAPSSATAKGQRVVLRVLAEKRCDAWLPVRGNLLLFISDSSGKTGLETGDRVFLFCKPERIPGAELPGSFNAALFYAGKGCYFQGFVKNREVFRLKPANEQGIFSLAGRLRNRMLHSIRDHMPDESALGVAGALLLGYEDWLDPELETSYNSAGVLHVLCVSGMHVMLIYVILQWLFSFMDKNWFGKQVKFLLLLLLIWFYAMLTGFSPSVLRAAAMATFVMAGTWLGRNVSVYNLLCASCILLFCMNPWMIASAGFQLSFLAVCGIVFIHPFIRLWWQPANGMLQKTWELISVSLSAQLATMPMSLWMFHQFPNYFLLGNLVLVPLSTVVMYSGMAMLSLTWLTPAADALGWITSKLIIGLNATVSFIGALPGACTENVFISTPGMILLYLILTGLVLWLVFKRFVVFQVVLCLGLLFLGEIVYRDLSERKREQFLVMPGKSASHFVFIHGTQSLRIRTDAPLPSFRERTMKDYLLQKKVVETTGFILCKPGIYFWRHAGIMVVHNLNRLQRVPEAFQGNPRVLILSGKTAGEAEQLAAMLTPKEVIIDRSVNNRQSVQMENAFGQKNIRVHRVTGRAYVSELR